MSMTPEEWDLVQKAWTILDRERGEFVSAKILVERAAGRWVSTDDNFITAISDKGVTYTGIEAHDDGDWDTNSVLVEAEIILDTEGHRVRSQAVIDVVEAIRMKEAQQRTRKLKQEQYERLKKELFEGGS